MTLLFSKLLIDVNTFAKMYNTCIYLSHCCHESALNVTDPEQLEQNSQKLQFLDKSTLIRCILT